MPLVVPTGRLRSWGREITIIAVVTLGVLSARSSVADHYHVPSGSMLPSIQVGDRILVNKLAFGLRLPFSQRYLAKGDDPRRGDVVVLDSPDAQIVLLKRVVAGPGDIVEVTDGRVILNGRATPMAKGRSHWLEALRPGETHPVRLTAGGGRDLSRRRIPDNKFLVLGDNRGDSRDGRVFGLVDRGAILGRAMKIYYSSGDLTWRDL